MISILYFRNEVHRKKAFSHRVDRKRDRCILFFGVADNKCLKRMTHDDPPTSNLRYFDSVNVKQEKKLHYLIDVARSYIVIGLVL